MARDYYAEALQIAHHLEADGFLTEAKTLQDAITNGVTSTEILMELRWQLKHLNEESIQTSSQMIDLIRELYLSIGDALTG